MYDWQSLRGRPRVSGNSCRHQVPGSRPEIEVYSHGMLFISVCTRVSIERTLELVNQRFPTGVSSDWQLHDGPFGGGQPNPGPCEEWVGYRHLLLRC